MDGVQTRRRRVVEHVLVVREDEVLVTPGRDDIRPAPNLFGKDTVHAGRRPGVDQGFEPGRFALEDGVKQAGRIVLDQHQSLKPDHGIGSHIRGADDGPKEIAVPLVGHNQARQVEIPSPQKSIGV